MKLFTYENIYQSSRFCFIYIKPSSVKINSSKKFSSLLVIFRQIIVAYMLAGISSASANDLNEVKTLIDLNVPELALAMIDRHQPDVQDNQPQWLRWERQRFELYKLLDDHQRLNDRINNLPSKLPAAFYHWTLIQGIKSHLDQSKAAAARSLSRNLLWGQYGKLEPARLNEVRRLIIISYLIEGLSNDAYQAIESYRTDQKKHGPHRSSTGQGSRDSRVWSLLYAQVLIIDGRPERASKILADLSGDDIDPLKLLVELILKQKTPDQIVSQGNKKKKKLGKHRPALFAYWAVIAQASKVKNDYKSQLWALEKILSVEKKDNLFGNLYSARADDLWQAYLGYGNSVKQKLAPDINEQKLFDHAKSFKVEKMFATRSLFAYLAFNADDKSIRNKAHKAFVSTLYLNKLGHRVVNRLYLDSERFVKIDMIPAVVRHMMIGKALKKSDIQLASSLLEGLVNVPDGINSLDWRLRQARVHILAGKFQQGMQVLLSLFQEVDKLSNKQVDRLLQVLFDLQAVGKHRTVFPLFETVMKRTQDKARKREILYWMADSMSSLEEFDEAARYYLKSAGLIEPESMDLWAQSARFQAGEALARAGLVLDAKGVFQGLLKVTSDPGRKALLQRKIEKLKSASRL